jgi:exopolysaccharide production protein ExoQ
MLSVRFTALVRFQRWWLPVLIVTSGVGFIIVVQSLPGYYLFDRELTSFNSRSVLWSMAWSGILIKPVVGWGWQAAWHVREFWEQGAWWSVSGDNDWSHNGYLDVLLGGGFIAGCLFITLIVLATSRMSNRSEWSKLWPHIVLFTFIVAAATQESCLVGSHFLWALLTCLVTIHWENPNPLLKQQDSTKLAS